MFLSRLLRDVRIILCRRIPLFSLHERYVVMSSEPSDTPIRTLGRYDLLKKIAEGGMGAVYRGRSHATGEIVAVKVVPPSSISNEVLRQRFKKEFDAARMLDHPNIVRAIDFDDSGPEPYLVMEFVDGESMGGRVEREGPMPEAEAVRLMVQVCEGLHRAHKQALIHRDVKPDNILIRKDGVAKLTDMGLVKDVEGDQNLTKTGRGLGTPHFMAPEQFRDAKHANVQCDIYSLGATLYMVVTGVIPFAKTTPLDCWMKKTKNDFHMPRKIMPGLSDQLEGAILRAMSADPAQRQASCREFIEDITGKAWKKVDDTSSPDLTGQASTAETAPLVDIWYLVYKNPEGEQKTVKGNTERIRENLKAGALGDPGVISVCRTKQGPFLPVKGVPEFRVYVIKPQVIVLGGAPKPGAAPLASSSGPNPSKPVAPKAPVAPDHASNVATDEHNVQPMKGPVSAPPPPVFKRATQPPISTPTKPTKKPKRKPGSGSDWVPWVMIGVALVVGAIAFLALR